MARESALWGWLSKARLLLPHNVVRLLRIENLIENGTPDVAVCCSGVWFWIELKSAARPSRPTTNVQFPHRPDQADWMRDAWANGDERSGWLLQVAGKGKTARYYITGKYANEVDAGLTERELDRLNALSSPYLSQDAIILEVLGL